MEALDALMGRRSIRAYTGQHVTDEQVETLLRAAMAAPSACNQQPWEYVVARNRETLSAVPSFHPFSSMLPNASCGIFVCCNAAALANPKCAPFWVQDCSAATQNILLAAHAMGLGAVWLGAYPNQEICTRIAQLLSLPEGITAFSMVAVGVPAEHKAPSQRFDPRRVHHETW